MTLKGTREGEAVMCTKSATFALKTVETTNSLLLVEVLVHDQPGCCCPAPCPDPPASAGGWQAGREPGAGDSGCHSWQPH